MNELQIYVIKEAEKKKKSPEEWLMNIAENASKCKLATHIGKFVNPKVGNVTVKVELGTGGDEEYITTANTDCQADIATSAAFLPTAVFLNFRMEDGQSVYWHIKVDRSFLEKKLPNLEVDYAVITNKLLDIEAQPVATDERLRQVYFPIDSENEDYHLLTVLPSASLMVELHNRIKAMQDEEYQVLDKQKYKDAGDDYTKIYDLTEIGFGGSNPQNVSYQSSQLHGRSYLLKSVPPVIKQRNIIQPRKNFFLNRLSRGQYDLFKELHEIYENNKNTLRIRIHVRNVEMMIVNSLLISAYGLRQLEAGWTDRGDNSLPMAQKIWLDAKYKQRYTTETSWIEEIVDGITHWFMENYEFVEKKEKLTPLMLGDVEYNAMKKRILDAVVAFASGEE